MVCEQSAAPHDCISNLHLLPWGLQVCEDLSSLHTLEISLGHSQAAVISQKDPSAARAHFAGSVLKLRDGSFENCWCEECCCHFPRIAKERVDGLRFERTAADCQSRP